MPDISTSFGTGYPSGGGMANAVLNLTGFITAIYILSTLSVNWVTGPNSPKHPAAALNSLGSETDCSTPFASTYCTSATRSLKVVVDRPAPWQMGALEPPKVISTIMTLK